MSINGALAQANLRAAVAGNAVSKSGVMVKNTAAKESSSSSLASIKAWTNSVVAAWIASSVLASAVVAPRIPRHAVI